MMQRHFLRWPIRWQIMTLAVLPVLVVSVLALVFQKWEPDDTELSSAELAAAQIALVTDQVEQAGSAELAEIVLAATRKAGLPVDRVASSERPTIFDSVFDERVLYALSSIYGRTAWAVAIDGADSRIVVELADGLLAFSPKAALVPNTVDDFLMIQAAIVFLPMILLSIYAARLITGPLTRIAAEARAQGSADPTDGEFSETGPQEIRLLGRRLNEMRLQIRGMLEQRTAMLRAVSHDLRTPLTRLQLRIERSVPAETAEILLRDITALNDMIDETLNYLRTDSEQEAPRRTDLPSLLRTVCSDFSDVGFPVTYSGPDRLTFECRSRALARAVSNLVDNGTKFGENVEVALTPLPEGAIRIVVSDDGDGLPEAMRTRMLEPFVKADPSRPSSSRSGFGLGLSIVHEVVRRHGGTLTLEPRDPSGIAATIFLPDMAGARG